MTQDMSSKMIIEENIFPRREQNIPTLGTKHSHAGNKTGLRFVLSLLLLLMLMVVSSTALAIALESGAWWSYSIELVARPEVMVRRAVT